MDALVSVIVPIYNVEKYLRRCVDSILNQTYTNLEIILVDDGSPDYCGDICDEYAARDSRVKVIHQKNGGLSAARNAGLDIASGEYIAFVDSDDWVSEKFIETLSSRAGPGILTLCNVVFWDSKDNYRTAMPEDPDEEIGTYEFWVRTTAPNCTPYIVAWSKLYPKTIFENLRFSQGLFHEDEAILHHVIKQVTHIHVIYEPLYYYRQNDSSIMGQGFNPRRLDGFVAWAERLEYFRKHGFEEAENALADKYWTRYKDQIFAVDPSKDVEGHRKRGIQHFKIAFPSLLRAKSIKVSQKVSIIAMRISPKVFQMMWTIIKIFK